MTWARVIDADALASQEPRPPGRGRGAREAQRHVLRPAQSRADPGAFALGRGRHRPREQRCRAVIDRRAQEEAGGQIEAARDRLQVEAGRRNRRVGMLGLWQVDVNIARLADAECAVGRLIFDRRVPPARQVNGVIRRGKRQTDAARLGRQDHRVEPARPRLEGINCALALIAGDAAVDARNRVRRRISSRDLNRE